MNAGLRGTLGWRMTRHAKEAAARRGFALADVLQATAHPDLRYTSEHYGSGREVRIRGDLAVVVHAPSLAIITVLWHHDRRWTDADARGRGTSCAA
jgi:hypothetical protein